MPIYEYECVTHGMFERYRPMSESGKAGDCPTCGRQSPRVLSAPNVRLVSPAMRSAVECNERSRHAPHVCGGHRPRRQGAAADTTKPKLTTYKGPRPWVIEHR